MVMKTATDHIIRRDTLEILPEVMTRYVKATVLNRAIPDVRDGLKPVQRRIIYAMATNKMGAADKYVKLTKATGLVMGSFHPHGDSSINEATIFMSQPWRYNVPLVNTEGNNGSLDGDPPAAARYLEVRLAKPAMSLLAGIKDGAVEMLPTFDNTTVEPNVLPADWPVLFTNGQMGMSVGFATNIASHNPVELLKAARLINKKPTATLSEVMRLVKGPDFPTGGIIMGRDGLKELYRSGKGSFIIRGKATIDKNMIVVSEIPYGVNKKDLLESMYDALDTANLLDQVRDLRDESEGLGVRIVIELSKSANASLILNVLYQKSNLQLKFNANHLAILDSHPTQLGLVQYLNAFLSFKRVVEERKFAAEQDRLQKRLHIVEGLLKLIDIADKVIAEIRKADGRSDAVARIVQKFDFSKLQAEAIVSLRLYQISKQDMLALKTEQANLKQRLKQLEAFLTDATAFSNEITRQLEDTILRFKDYKRKTVIQDEVETIDIDETDLIKEQKTTLVLRPNGVQRMSELVYQNNKDKAVGTILQSIPCLTTDGLVMLTKKGLSMQRIVNDVAVDSVKVLAPEIQKDVAMFKYDDEILAGRTFSLKDDFVLEAVAITKLGRIKRVLINSALLSFNNKGYLKRGRFFFNFKDDADEIIDLKIGTHAELDKKEVSVKRHSGGKVKTLAYRDLHVQAAAGSGQVLLKLTKADDFLEVLGFTDEK